MAKVEFYSNDFREAGKITYVVVGARHRGEWLFVKSRKRGSYELPAGHTDSGESPADAAGRELMEETGAQKFIIECINTYSVKGSDNILWGKLYLADILEYGNIIDSVEIESVSKGSELEGNSAYREVQEILLEKLKETLNNLQAPDISF